MKIHVFITNKSLKVGNNFLFLVENVDGVIPMKSLAHFWSVLCTVHCTVLPMLFYCWNLNSAYRYMLITVTVITNNK